MRRLIPLTALRRISSSRLDVRGMELRRRIAVLTAHVPPLRFPSQDSTARIVRKELSHV